MKLALRVGFGQQQITAEQPAAGERLRRMENRTVLHAISYPGPKPISLQAVEAAVRARQEHHELGLLEHLAYDADDGGR
jgi:hypothetical protein